MRMALVIHVENNREEQTIRAVVSPHRPAMVAFPELELQPGDGWGWGCVGP